jgi:hypothetical protein
MSIQSEADQIERQVLCDPCAELRDLLTEDLIYSPITTPHPGDDLTHSPCRLCRFFGHFFALQYTQDIQRPQEQQMEYESQVHNVYLKGSAFLPGSMGIVRTRGADNTLSEPHILVSRLSHDDTMARLQDMYPLEANLDLVKGWMGECETGHDAHCSLRRRSRPRNLKLIDCEEDRVVDAPQNCKFVALSYVWGEPTNTSGASTYDLEEWEHLPMTIQQCIRITFALGYKYLWIDRYVRRRSPRIFFYLTRTVHQPESARRTECPDLADGRHIYCSAVDHSRRCRQ